MTPEEASSLADRLRRSGVDARSGFFRSGKGLEPPGESYFAYALAPSFREEDLAALGRAAGEGYRWSVSVGSAEWVMASFAEEE